MDLAWHGQVQGVDTFRWLCPSCAGIVNLQTMKNPQTGASMVRQVALNGDPSEYAPADSVKLLANSASGWDREYDLTDEITPAFSISPTQGVAHMPGSFFQGQLQQRVPGAVVPQPARPVVPAQLPPHPYLAQIAQAQVAYPPGHPAGAIHQQVAYTLGEHSDPVPIPDPNELRRRILGLPRHYGRRRR
jgi:hypothetical protein